MKLQLDQMCTAVSAQQLTEVFQTLASIEGGNTFTLETK